MSSQNHQIDRKTALQTLFAGVVASVFCALTWQFGFVSRFAFVFAPAFLTLGLAGLIDPRILQGALKKPGQSISHLPAWARYAGYMCWTPSLVALGWMLAKTFGIWAK